MKTTLLKKLSSILLIFLSAPSFADVAGPFEPLQFQNGIELSDPQGLYRTNIRFRIQNLLEMTTKSSDDFSIREIRARTRRARLRISGFAYHPRLTYQLQLSFSKEDQDWTDSRFPNILRDANILYAFIQSPEESLIVSFGQGKLPGNRQRVISSGDLQFADRAILNRVFNIDRDFGVQALYRREHWNIRASISSGEGRNLPVASDWGLAYVGRLEFLPFGAFQDREDYVEGDLKQHRDLRLSLAATHAVLRNSNRSGGTIGSIFTSSGDPNSGSPLRRDQSVTFIDAIAKRRGWSLQVEYANRTSPNGLISANQALFEGTGWMFQSGYFLSDKLETVARFSRVSPESQAKADPKNLLIAQSTLGANYYFQGHRVKLQTDVTRQSLSDPCWIARVNFELGI